MHKISNAPSGAPQRAVFCVKNGREMRVSKRFLRPQDPSRKMMKMMKKMSVSVSAAVASDPVDTNVAQVEKAEGSKRYRALRKLLEQKGISARTEEVNTLEAMQLLTETSTTKFVGAAEVGFSSVLCT